MKVALYLSDGWAYALSRGIGRIDFYPSNWSWIRKISTVLAFYNFLNNKKRTPLLYTNDVLERK
jgi:hypothetical protein